jgi:hypothetical protein
VVVAVIETEEDLRKSITEIDAPEMDQRWHKPVKRHKSWRPT